MKRVIYFAFAIAIGLVSTDLFAQPPAAQEREGRRTGERAQEGRQRPGGPRAETQTVAPKPAPVALKEGVATLSPENSKVEFVGTHTGDEPKPRLGGFKKFTGSMAVAEDNATIKSLSMDFDTTSLWTEIGDKLTTHLKNADFLDVEKYPTAKFVSKSVSAGEKSGTFDVVGDFTLMGKTNEITIPVSLTKDDAGVLVKGELNLDRASFGMNKMADRVSNEVAITISIGEKTHVAGAQPTRAAGAGGRGQGGRGGWDPAAFFKNQDANGDGKLSGEEIPERMRDRVESIDANKDGAITLEEMQKSMQNRGGGEVDN